MQIYVHTVFVLHRLVLDDKKEVKCVLCVGGGLSPNQSSTAGRSRAGFREEEGPQIYTQALKKCIMVGYLP